VLAEPGCTEKDNSPSSPNFSAIAVARRILPYNLSSLALRGYGFRLTVSDMKVPVPEIRIIEIDDSLRGYVVFYAGCPDYAG
jgi:hypothetical protein